MTYGKAIKHLTLISASAVMLSVAAGGTAQAQLVSGQAENLTPEELAERDSRMGR